MQKTSQTLANCGMGPNISKHLYLHDILLCCDLFNMKYWNTQACIQTNSKVFIKMQKVHAVFLILQVVF